MLMVSLLPDDAGQRELSVGGRFHKSGASHFVTSARSFLSQGAERCAPARCSSTSIPEPDGWVGKDRGKSMENGPAALPNRGAGDHRERNGDGHVRPAATASTPGTAIAGRHKRSLSGSLLTILPFVRSSLEGIPASPESAPPRNDHSDGRPVKKGGAMAAAVRQTRGRKRKGSLRKTAILGTGKLKRSPSTRQAGDSSRAADEGATTPDVVTPRRFSYESPSAASSEDNGWTPPSDQQLLVDASTAIHHDERSAQPSQTSTSTTTNASKNTYGSTTDEEDALTFDRPANSGAMLPAPGTTPYLPLQPAGAAPPPLRRRSTKAHPPHAPPLAHAHAASAALADDEWDYSETEWWGWAVLLVTWLVFVVGMGSCLGVWSWAWDVGETPYAPPELEDDPTLPIVGYYPALMVLTAVMAWVWVVVAWVGMKYFRHAKVVGEGD